MLERCVLFAVLLSGCASAALPALESAPAREPSTLLLHEPASTGVAHKSRHVARLAPPFAAAGGTRRISGGEAPTALVAVP
jgi:hypothetical protein